MKLTLEELNRAGQVEVLAVEVPHQVELRLADVRQPVARHLCRPRLSSEKL